MISAPPDMPVLTVSGPGRVRGVGLLGGSSGLLVRGTNGVAIEGVTVSGAVTHGIEVVDASAAIEDVHVSGLSHPYAQGVEFRNSDHRPDSRISGSHIESGMEGIVTHVADVRIFGNTVAHTSMRAIAVTEMSDGWVRGNEILSAAGTALYCGDMSRCEFADNRMDVVTAAGSNRSAQGWGLVVSFHASASTSGDQLMGQAGDHLTLVSSRVTERSPLEPGAGSRALWPALIPIAVALMALALLTVAVRRSFGGERPPRARLTPALATAVTVGVTVGVIVQSFHMSEHLLQFFRVKIDGVPSRGGLAGPAVETEWVHLAYNLVVVMLMAGLLVARRHGWGPQAWGWRDHLLVAGTALQGYHALEHAFKIGQHLDTGAKVNPGILGHAVDLVHLHLALNAAVYLAFIVPVLGYALRARMRSGIAGMRSGPSMGLSEGPP